jgi:hypothetical protein
VTRVRALEERRKEHEIRFPNVEGYRVVFPRKPLHLVFTKDSGMEPMAVRLLNRGSQLGWQVAVDLEADADLEKG